MVALIFQMLIGVVWLLCGIHIGVMIPLDKMNWFDAIVAVTVGVLLSGLLTGMRDSWLSHQQAKGNQPKS